MAGLLSRAWGMVDPILPDEQIMGLLGRVMGRGPAPQNQPIAPGIQHSLGLPVTDPVPAQGGQMQPQGPGLGAYLEGLLLTGRAPSQVRQDYQTRQDLDRVVTDPRERLTARLNPKEWAGQNATRYGYHNVGAGSAAMFGDPAAGGTTIRNNQLGFDKGRGYELTPDGINSLGELAPAFGEETDRMEARAKLLDATGEAGRVVRPGDIVLGPDGQVKFRAPFAPDYKTVGAGDKLVEVGGEQGPAVSGESLAKLALQIAPGAVVTSGMRSAANNAAVGGVANSYHKTGQAVDLRPAPGQTVQELGARLKANVGPGVDVVVEDDHVHLEPSSQPGGARVVAEGAPRSESPAARREFAQLRKEFNQLEEVKNFKDVSASYREIRALTNKPNPTPSDDMAITFKVMRMLDPTSVVREGEYALVGKQAGLPDQIVMGLNRLDEGKGLTPTIRNQLVQTAASILLQRREAYDGVAGTYRQIAGDYGADPNQLAPEPGAWRKNIKQPAGQGQQTASAPGAPKPGSVVKGYRFNGGDPSKQANWSKVR